MSFDYDALRLFSWGLLGLSLLGCVICEGLSLGTTMLICQVADTDTQRKTIYTNIAPTSLGLQAWLMVTIAILFAGWPTAYAVFFSSLQPLLLIMLPLWLFRPWLIYFRDALEHPQQQETLDKILSTSAYLLVAFIGLIAGNLLKGIPFHLDSDMRIYFLGNIWELFNPFALLIAACSVALFLVYGATFLQMTAANEIALRCQIIGLKAGLGFIVLFALSGLWLMHLEGYHINSEIVANAFSNPLSKFVKRGEGLWLDNYEHLPQLWLIPCLAISGAGACLYLSRRNRYYLAFLAAVISVSTTLLTLIVSMFPFILPSNRSLNSSLTIWDASADQNSLSIFVYCTAALLPILAIASRRAFKKD